MSSGMGVRGTIGRCYGFFADYKQCQVRSGLMTGFSLRDAVDGNNLTLTNELVLV